MRRVLRADQHQCTHSIFAVILSFIPPSQRSFPVQLFRKDQGHAVLFKVGGILRGVESDLHAHYCMHIIFICNPVVLHDTDTFPTHQVKQPPESGCFVSASQQHEAAGELEGMTNTRFI